MKVAIILLVCMVALVSGRSHFYNAIRRPGRCPDTSDIITICLVTENNCWSDAQCGPGQKCCPRGCGRECLNVVYGGLYGR